MGEQAFRAQYLALNRTRARTCSSWVVQKSVRGTEACACHGLTRFFYSWLLLDKSTRVPISAFHCAVRQLGIRVEAGEVECNVANMIYKGLMRGYISHERQTVVLAAKDAFPRVADRKTPFIS